MTMKSPHNPGGLLKEDVIAKPGLSMTEAVQRLVLSRVHLGLNIPMV